MLNQVKINGACGPNQSIVATSGPWGTLELSFLSQFQDTKSKTLGNYRNRLFLSRVSKSWTFLVKIRNISSLEGYLWLILKKSRAIKKYPLYQKFRRNISSIFLRLYIYLSYLYEGVVFPLKSWIHFKLQNSVLLTFSLH